MPRGHFPNAHAIPQLVVILVSTCAFLVPLILATAADVFASMTPTTLLNGRATTDPQLTQWVVTSMNDSGPGSLRQLILDANPGDLITFGPNVTGVISLTTGELDITKSLTIDGPGASVLAISGNSASTVFRVATGTVQIRGLFISDYLTYAHAVYNSGQLTLEGTKIDNRLSFPSSFDPGGSVFNAGILTMVHSRIVRSLASNPVTQPSQPCISTYGIYNWGTLTLMDSTFADLWGSAILNRQGSATLINVTFSGTGVSILNGLGSSACGPGAQGVTTITNSTVQQIFNRGGTITLNNSIVAEGCEGSVSLGHNLTSSSLCNLTATGDITSANLMLAPLGDYGGPTQTRMPLPGSPAIDAGDNANCPTTDQRNVARPIDGDKNGVAICDIGAVEFNLTSTHLLPLIMR